MSWLPVIQVSADTWAGFLNGDLLYIGTFDAPSRPIDPESPIALLPLLTRPRMEVLAELRPEEKKHGLPAGRFTERIPLGALPGVALAGGMPYRLRAALDRVGAPPYSAEVAGRLADVRDARGMPQDIRHRAARLMNYRANPLEPQ
ncbi:hypothetical protein [Spongiactinospora sp. 9N601]|uniref:hypothetical protein n=1 Tax=Spongiactinospora sp. 9N601 TaxID=3375149 RepID=UPI0037AD0436